MSRFRHALAALAILSVSLGLATARSSLADDLEAAKKAVTAASASDLLAEFQRRSGERSLPKTRGMTTRSIDAVSPLATIDEGVLVKVARERTRTIYGTDDRVDWYEIGDTVRPLARASVALINTSDTLPSQTSVDLKVKTLGETHELCPDEMYATQPAVAFCSGTLVGPDLVLTAGHCVNEVSKNAAIAPLPEVSFVFGYRMESATSSVTSVSPDQVFAGKELIGGELDNNRDWALVRLARPVPATIAEPVAGWNKGPVAVGQRVFVIGYPSGIPLKYAPGAQVRDQSNPNFFVANLDTFGGNSGSGVFDQATSKLIGVLVRGDADFVRDNTENCNRVHICPMNGCRGEDVTHLSVVSALQ
jgi:hypothetical protein